MIDPNKIDEKAETLSRLLGERLRIRGRTFEQRLVRAGRLLPRRLRHQGRRLAEAQAMAAHPKLARLPDLEAIDAAYADLRKHLEAIDPAERRKGAILNWLGALAVNLIAMTTILVAILRWRGFL